ncbi:efflux RND transporter permease subunit [Saccharophagus degradans]|uniref:efflux RND transporter permease subunit n=1 Tax=Saccharophagus degradans TaxID=86304 RepID=UPI001C0841DA|nr:efflux RND transporter permease subunit [Saccharophagus degradans]MBU2983740.1 efflux RND transporter permease subunit [Saccharophagus degradans]
MNLTQFSLENNRTVFVVLSVLLLAGILTFQSMPRAYDPGFTIRAAQVVTQLPGASSERVEQLITDKIEDAIQQMPELDFVTSESRSGVSIVVVNIKESYTDMRPIWDSLRRKVDGVVPDLPDGIIGPFVNDEFGDVYGIVLTVTGEGFSYAELMQAASDARSEYLRISDVAKVDILGEQEQHVFIDYNNARLSELNISPYQLSQMLESRNIVSPGGAVTLGSERILLEATGNFESVEDIANSVLRIPNTQTLIVLKDIATVYRGYLDPAPYKIHSNGQPALALAIAMRDGGNNITLGQEVLKITQYLQNSYPIGMDFNVINFSPEEVRAKVQSFVSNLLQAIAVVTLVVLFSLGLRTGLIVAALIPFSMLIALLVMDVFTIGLNQISLAALIIALGMLVDNGIVMSESIIVKMAEGKNRIEAALVSANELKIPLLTSSLTTAAAFLPIYLAESSTGEFTSALFKVVTITLLGSWLLSMTVIPLLCSQFLKVKQTAQEFGNTFYSAYRRVLKCMIKFRYASLIVVMAMFALSLQGLKHVPNIFFPPSDRAYFKVELELPQGRSLQSMEQVVAGVEAFIGEKFANKGDENQVVTDWISYIGNGGTRFVLTHTPKPNSPNYALLVLNTKSTDVIDAVMDSIENYVRNTYPDVVAKMKKFETGSPIDNPVEFRISGTNDDRLFEIVTELKQQMNRNPRLKNVTDNWGIRSKKLLINIDQARALRAGVSNEDIATSLQAGMSGVRLTQYRERSDIIPVTLRSDAALKNDINKLESLSVFVQTSGKSVPLKQVADIEVVWEPGKIVRRNRAKTVTVGAQLVGEYTAAENYALLQPWLETKSKDWGIGYRYELGGEAESSTKANQSIMKKLPVAVLIIVILLVGQFNSLRKAGIVLLTIPLGLIGVVLGLLISHSSMGFMTLLGIISLSGIVINNAIVLLERIQLEIDDFKRTPLEAVIEAAQRRVRPILLTTATTILGLLPLYLSGGELWESMTISIMCGLLFATVLTLLIVPVLYVSLFQVKLNPPIQ